MLARLEEMKDKATVEVDRSGTLIRITPAPRAEDVRALLEKGGTKTELLDRAAAAQAATTATAWFSRANVRDLSREEFRILSRRWAGEFQESAELSEDQQGRLISSLERAFDRAVTLIPTEQGIPQDPTVWRKAKADAIQNVLADAASYLQPTQLEKVRAGLEATLSE